MKDQWLKQLKYDPTPVLLACQNDFIKFFVRRDLLDEEVGPISSLWDLPTVAALIRRQQEDGSWNYPSKGRIRSATNYNQLETYRNLGILVEKHGLNKRHAAIRKAADFLFPFQTQKGDFRGIYGNQYSPNYSAGIMELLIRAGYQNDLRIKKGFEWLKSVRQNDGGWAIPFRTRASKLEAILDDNTLEPDQSRPYSHFVTGVVLRAYAASKVQRRSAVAKKGAQLLASRFFMADKYSDRSSRDFWERCSFPFWFTDIVSSLDSLSLIGLSAEEPQIQKALNWLRTKQRPDGIFELKLVRGRDKDLKYWMCLAICRIFKRFYA